MRADNSHHLRAAARRRALATRERAVRALRRLDATGQSITFDTVACEASVSRSWLYGQADLRAEIERLRMIHGRAPISSPVPARQRASDASLRRRLEAVNAEIRRLREENHRLREQLAWVHGERRAASIHAPARQGGASTHGPPEAIGPCS